MVGTRWLLFFLIFLNIKYLYFFLHTIFPSSLAPLQGMKSFVRPLGIFPGLLMGCLGNQWSISQTALWAHNPNFLKVHVAVMWKLIIQSGHNFAHAMTAELSWHVQNCDLVGLPESKLEQKNIFARFQFWAHKPFVKWTPVNLVSDHSPVRPPQNELWTEISSICYVNCANDIKHIVCESLRVNVVVASHHNKQITGNSINLVIFWCIRYLLQLTLCMLNICK